MNIWYVGVPNFVQEVDCFGEGLRSFGVQQRSNCKHFVSTISPEGKLGLISYLVCRCTTLSTRSLSVIIYRSADVIVNIVVVTHQFVSLYYCKLLAHPHLMQCVKFIIKTNYIIESIMHFCILVLYRNVTYQSFLPTVTL